MVLTWVQYNNNIYYYIYIHDDTRLSCYVWCPIIRIQARIKNCEKPAHISPPASASLALIFSLFPWHEFWDPNHVGLCYYLLLFYYTRNLRLDYDISEETTSQHSNSPSGMPSCWDASCLLLMFSTVLWSQEQGTKRIPSSPQSEQRWSWGW
jgi:hypothetical protein